MKEDELRKSIRRQKLEKQGLSVSQIITATSAGTGTGTSDDEDDASTPSGDNAERSLASTLGGSSESIPHPSTFLQVALDGPDLGRDKERGLFNATKCLRIVFDNGFDWQDGRASVRFTTTTVSRRQASPSRTRTARRRSCWKWSMRPNRN